MRGGLYSDLCLFLCVRQREGLDYVMVRGAWRDQLHVVKESRRPVVGKGATSGPSLNSSPHYSIHEAEALRAPLGMNERVPPFS